MINRGETAGRAGEIHVITLEGWKDVVLKALAQAQDGNDKAREWLSQYLLPRAGDTLLLARLAASDILGFDLDDLPGIDVACALISVGRSFRYAGKVVAQSQNQTRPAQLIGGFYRAAATAVGPLGHPRQDTWYPGRERPCSARPADPTSPVTSGRRLDGSGTIVSTPAPPEPPTRPPAPAPPSKKNVPVFVYWFIGAFSSANTRRSE
jgi:hypothetical protein